MQRSAEEGCDIEFKDGSITGEDCAKLERLEQFARTMMSSGKIGNFVRTLYSLRSYAKKHAEERAEAEGRDAPGARQHFLLMLFVLNSCCSFWIAMGTVLREVVACLVTLVRGLGLDLQQGHSSKLESEACRLEALQHQPACVVSLLNLGACVEFHFHTTYGQSWECQWAVA